jgi:hypothetical protein
MICFVCTVKYCVCTVYLARIRHVFLRMIHANTYDRIWQQHINAGSLVMAAKKNWIPAQHDYLFKAHIAKVCLDKIPSSLPVFKLVQSSWDWFLISKFTWLDAVNLQMVSNSQSTIRRRSFSRLTAVAVAALHLRRAGGTAPDADLGAGVSALLNVAAPLPPSSPPSTPSHCCNVKPLLQPAEIHPSVGPGRAGA